MPAARAAVLLVATVLLAGCGSSTHRSGSPTASDAGIPARLLREERPQGVGPRFHPPATGPALGACTKRLGPRTEVHVELFAANRVVLLGAGIGTRPPRMTSADTITHARCYGALVTLDPTGVVYVRRGLALTMADLFRSWGEALSSHRLASFRTAPGRSVSAFFDGHRLAVAPGAIRLRRHAEIVLEIGPYVPPHRGYTFPPAP